ncbi:MAG: (d)CMP kinase [Candidatus Marinimicrobia bacterium]|nr:(d)CMP kinase [Candidatus Neomarinimicrobiota bacterium]MBL7023111.1 (d)CMP kinase [Candidatus Neomarinimicrobiota bacterium]MBL7109131.1 (d)CMP kinase [Candidatus Neomarinimicrobiota bacterium]
MIIAIDGPAASGKSTTAKRVAEQLEFIHIDTGAMYRAVTQYFLSHNINFDNQSEVKKHLRDITLNIDANKRIIIDEVDVTDDIRKNIVNDNVSQVSTIYDVRKKMVDIQRKMSENENVVMEGRDIGTRVFPNADYKFFIIADAKERGIRRLKELENQGETVDLDTVILGIKERDKIDSSREYSPLVKAEDAIIIDTTNLSIDEQVKEIIDIVKNTKQGVKLG